VQLELQKYRDNLEEQVEKRTIELDNANKRLKIEIEDHKKTEVTLEKYLTELKRSNKELQQFAYVASHDLQEPLRMVSSFTQLLAKKYKGQLDSDADEFIKYAVDGAQRMQMLINDLLAYSRVSSRVEEFQLVDLEKAFNESLQNLKVSIDDNDARITCDSLPTIVADQSQIIQLFQNLIGNAIKFRSNETPEIHIAVEEGEDEWIFRVIDNGIGIDSQHNERIFRVFQRLHERDSYPGTGIGLSICEKIVERHGGDIWVDSKLGNGSTFSFTISKYI
jgi:light-regulated signal transduction histidine kinase (bacteriophytochrome)